MPSTPHTVKLTYEDYLLFPDDGRRHELIGGDHYVTPVPGRKHQIALGNLLVFLHGFLRERDLGRVYLAPFDVVVSHEDVVQPDLVFVSRERAAQETENGMQGAPDLAVEILSESSRRTDEIVKRKLYERAGVREYWVVDPVLETVKVYRATPKGFERAAELAVEAGDRLKSPLFPGLVIEVAEIFS